MILQTPRLTLRPWSMTDRDAYAGITSNPRAMEFLMGPLTREQSDQRIAFKQEHWQHHGFGRFAALLRFPGEGEDRGEHGSADAGCGETLIGDVGLNLLSQPEQLQGQVEIAWLLAPDAWGRGLASEAAAEVLRFAFAVLKLPEVVAITVPTNTRSRRVMEKIGMTLDPNGDFDHPLLVDVLPKGHALCRHITHRIRRAE
ncbi:MAG: GNAT family N-acetyltransferase [Acidobacteriota bacterium]